MRRWLLMLGGLLVWAAHFFAVYAAASIFPGDPAAESLALVATLAAIGANGILLWWTLGRKRTAADGFDEWTWRVGAIGAGLSLLAVLWQGMPLIAST
ncbi:MAG TPA: hypothetical protein VFO12_09190 [Sphingomicrobium sp.]|nr:hypothetical protein [Sphingomicrobium sp.]